LERSEKSIFGDDDRIDIYQETDPERRQWAASTAAIIPASRLIRDGRGNYILQPGTYSYAGIPVCDDVPFAGQPTGAICSAFMVGSDVIATAGHCLYPDELDDYMLVFGFEMQDENTPILVFSPDQVYEFVDTMDWALLGEYDHAVFRVDRIITATNARPLPIRREGRIELGENVGTIGHPTGLPSKISFGEDTVVNQNANPVYFGANIDAFGGNSGSAVFNAETGIVEGILVRGPAIEFILRGNCVEPAVYPNDYDIQIECSRTTIFEDVVPDSAFSPNIMEFKAIPAFTNTGNAVVALSWINPEDTRFQQIHLVRSASRFPTSVNDGRVLTSGNMETFVDRTVQNGVTYFYSLIAEVNDPFFPYVIAHDVAITGQNGKPELSQAFGPLLSVDNVPVNSLEYSQILFTPVDAPRSELGAQQFGDSTSYEVLFIPDVFDLPVQRKDEYGQATRLHMTDDGLISLGFGLKIPFFGKHYTSAFFSANGFLSFSRIQPWSLLNFPSLESHLAVPRIAFLFTDLAPDANGEVWFRGLDDRVVFTMEKIVERRGGYGMPAPHPSTVQVELFASGHIRITYLELGAQNAIVGLSPGRGLPVDVTEIASDLMPTPTYINIEDQAQTAQRISINPIPLKWAYAGQTLRFTVQANVPEGIPGTPKFTADWTGSGPAPFGDNGDGTGVFQWHTSFLDSGEFTVRFNATLGTQTAYQDVSIMIYDVFYKPEARNLTISTGKLGENPALSRIVEQEDRLTANYEYYHPLANEIPLFYGEGPTMLYWFRNGSKMPGLTNSKTVPPSFTQGGDQWTFRVIPYTSSYIRGLDAVSPVVTVSAAPRITSISPAFGSKEGGDTVIVRGLRFANTLEVRFGGVPVQQFHVLNSESIEVITPRSQPGTVDVEVRTQTGVGTIPSAFTYNGDDEIVIKADVNGDGRVDAQDLQLVINALLQLETVDELKADINPDVNRDGVVNSKDVQLVILQALGR